MYLISRMVVWNVITIGDQEKTRDSTWKTQ